MSTQKGPSRVQDGDSRVAWRNGRKKYFWTRAHRFVLQAILWFFPYLSPPNVWLLVPSLKSFLSVGYSRMVFFTNTQPRFVSVVFENPRVTYLPVSMYFWSFSLMGTVSAQKAVQRPETKTRELLEERRKNIIFPGSLICSRVWSQINDFLCKSKESKMS